MAEAPRGTPLLEWTFPEFAQYERGRGWFLAFFGFGAVMIGLALIAQIYTAIPIVILAGLILVLRWRRLPHDIRARITDLGFEVGGDAVRWDDLREFWIIYKPPEVKKLYVTFKAPVRQPYSIDLMDQNPLKIREVLSEFLPENVAQERETASDELLRMFKM